MRPILCCLAVLFALVANAKRKDYYAVYNTDAFWQKLVPDTGKVAPRLSEADTVIIVASNRQTSPDKLRFVSEERDRDSLRYFIVYTKGGRWHVQRQESLRAALGQMPRKDKDWVVYAEGMGKIFTTDLDRGLKLAGQYGVHVLLLDYPSIRSTGSSYANYRFAIRNANIAYRDFLPVLDSVRHLRKEGLMNKGSLSFFFHSMGNNIPRQIVQNGYGPRYNNEVWVDNFVLNAPCVRRRRSAGWIDSIRFAQRIIVHYNPEDRVLKGAQLIGFRRILGVRPDKRPGKKASYFNFQTLCGQGHSNFLNLYSRAPVKPEALRHYMAVLHGKMPDTGTKAYKSSLHYGVGWALIPAAIESGGLQ